MRDVEEVGFFEAAPHSGSGLAHQLHPADYASLRDVDFTDPASVELFTTVWTELRDEAVAARDTEMSHIYAARLFALNSLQRTSSRSISGRV